MPDVETSAPGGKPAIKGIDVSSLLSHVAMLNRYLPKTDDMENFGHAQPPQLHMARVPDPRRDGKELPVYAIMAVTKRCIAAQLVQSSKSRRSGAPVEVLVIRGNDDDDEITCATMISLELFHLTAADTGIYLDEEQRMAMERQESTGVSMLSGGLSSIDPSPRLAVIVGTKKNRVISVEFSVKQAMLDLVRRKYYVGKEEYTYFEPLPNGTLTKAQMKGKKPPRSSSITSNNSKESKKKAQALQQKLVVPFEPSGGVSTIAPYNLFRDGKHKTHVWISFGDGTAIRLHHAGFFPSVIQKHAESDDCEIPLERILGEPLVKWRAMMPPMPEDAIVTYVPLPKYHPSPLAPFPAWKKPEFDEIDTDEEQVDEYQDEVYEAAVYCNGAMADEFPTLAFYTSEDQFESRIPNGFSDDENSEYGVVGSMIGGIFGMFSGTKKPSEASPEEPPAYNASAKDPWDPSVPFPSMNFDPTKLYAGYEIHDPPRQITFCSIDPEGDLAAIADTLGRVSLVDLSTKQIVRMWKGFRDSVCQWIQTPRVTTGTPWLKTRVLYLVIHSRQRKVVEVYRTRHGPRVKTIQVGREAQLIGSRELTSAGYVSCCYIAHSNVPHSSLNQVQKIEFTEDEKEGHLTPRTRAAVPQDAIKVSQDAAMKLNHLKQLLDETSVDCQSVDVYRALQKINSLEDLSAVLDFLAKAPTLEGRMNVEGATFQKLAVSYCQQKLDEAMASGGKDAVTNPHIQRLAFKIAYYTQIASAYDVIHQYENGVDEGQGNVEVVAGSKWSVEAAGWTATYEKITRNPVDQDILDSPKEPVKFHAFASACVPPKDWMEAVYDVDNGGYKVYLSDSSRTRKEILLRIFKPLLGDVFSFNVVNNVFEALGIAKDHEYLLKVQIDRCTVFRSLITRTNNSRLVFWGMVYFTIGQAFND
eukprot:scaffold1246_cov134-Cylindrotheca_fusiformis.AAC.14